MNTDSKVNERACIRKLNDCFDHDLGLTNKFFEQGTLIQSFMIEIPSEISLKGVADRYLPKPKTNLQPNY